MIQREYATRLDARVFIRVDPVSRSTVFLHRTFVELVSP